MIPRELENRLAFLPASPVWPPGCSWLLPSDLRSQTQFKRKKKKPCVLYSFFGRVNRNRIRGGVCVGGCAPLIPSCRRILWLGQLATPGSAPRSLARLVSVRISFTSFLAPGRRQECVSELATPGVHESCAVQRCRGGPEVPGGSFNQRKPWSSSAGVIVPFLGWERSRQPPRAAVRATFLGLLII